MRPTLFHIGDVPIYPFFLTIMIGALIATFLAARMARKAGLSNLVVIDMGIIAIISSIIGTRVFHILFEYPGYYWEHPMRVFDFLSGGFVSLGAYVFSVAAWLVYFKRKKLPALDYMDIVSRAVPLIIFFVRTGCLLTGCCYGRPTDFFLHLNFPPGSTAYYYFQDSALHASQAYAMVNALVMLGVMHWVWIKRKFSGQVLASFLIYLGITRFMIEFTRGDVDRGIYLENLIPNYGISTGQIVMLLFVISGVLIYRHGLKKIATDA